MTQSTTLPPHAATSAHPGFRTGAIAFWCLVLALSLYFVVKNGIVGNAIPYLTAAEQFQSRHGTHGAWLFAHIIGGTCALLVGPLQFSTSIRRRYLTVHRLAGRVYLLSVVVSLVAAVRILLLPHSSFGFRIGIAGLSLAWLSTTGLAYVAVRTRHMLLHKEWMIRSYVVTFGFVFFRLLIDPMMSLQIATRPEIVSAVSWMCWAVPLLATEIVLSVRKLTS